MSYSSRPSCTLNHQCRCSHCSPRRTNYWCCFDSGYCFWCEKCYSWKLVVSDVCCFSLLLSTFRWDSGCNESPQLDCAFASQYQCYFLHYPPHPHQTTTTIYCCYSLQGYLPPSRWWTTRYFDITLRCFAPRILSPLSLGLASFGLPRARHLKVSNHSAWHDFVNGAQKNWHCILD